MSQKVQRKAYKNAKEELDEVKRLYQLTITAKYLLMRS